MLRRVAFILLLVSLSWMVSGQVNEHYLQCLEVKDDSVYLQWDKPVDEDSFVRYWVVRGMGSNPVFDTISEITYYDSTSFWDSEATANTQSNHYFIITDQSGILPVIYSDTLSTIHLRVDNSDNHLAVLDWNAIHDPLLPGMDTLYRIMLLDADGNFVAIDSLSGFHYEFPVLLCRAELTFRIELRSDFGCLSVSNDYFAVFADTDAPSMPTLDSVSVNPFTGETILGWSESSEPDVGGYIVYHAHVTNDTLAKIEGKDQTFFLDTTAMGCLEPKGYAIAARDTCGNIGPGTYDIPQRTILLEDIQFHPCDLMTTLNWTEYINMDPPLQGYKIYLSTDSSSFELLADISSTTLTYDHEGLEPGRNYRYFVRAYSTDSQVTSSSCIKSYSTWQYRQPRSNILDLATILQSEFAVLSMLPDTFAYLQQVNLYRSVSESGPYDLIAELDPGGSNTLFFDDLTAEVNLQSYYYKSSLIDSCGNEVLTTAPMRTILLQGEKIDALKVSLEWNAFEGWPEGVEEYRIYRALNETGSFQNIGTTQTGNLAFEDDIASLSGQTNQVRYIVGAFRGQHSNFSSLSNEVLFEFAPTLFLPNAFTPGGRNHVFKPVGTFAQFSEYRMDIYNRWGELVFSSQDFGEGWDGSYKGDTAPSGVYVCVLFYRSSNGEEETLKQSFVLIR